MGRGFGFSIEVLEIQETLSARPLTAQGGDPNPGLISTAIPLHGRRGQQVPFVHHAFDLATRL